MTFSLVTDVYRLGNFPLSVIANSHLGRLHHLNQLNHTIYSALIRLFVVSQLVELGLLCDRDYSNSVHRGGCKSR